MFVLSCIGWLLCCLSFAGKTHNTPPANNWVPCDDVQVMVMTISDAVIDYAQEVRRVLRREKFRVDLDESSSTVNRKVREAQLSKYNYFLVRHCGLLRTLAHKRLHSFSYRACRVVMVGIHRNSVCVHSKCQLCTCPPQEEIVCRVKPGFADRWRVYRLVVAAWRQPAL